MNTLSPDLINLLDKHFDCVESLFLSSSEYDPIRWAIYFYTKNNKPSLISICKTYRMPNFVKELFDSQMFKFKKHPDDLFIQYIELFSINEGLRNTYEREIRDTILKIIKSGDVKTLRKVYIPNTYLPDICEQLFIALRYGKNDVYQYLLQTNLDFINVSKGGELVSSMLECSLDKFRSILEKRINNPPFLITGMTKLIALYNDVKFMECYIDIMNKQRWSVVLDEETWEAVLRNNVDIEVVNLLIKNSNDKYMVLHAAYNSGYMPYYKKIVSEDPMMIERFHIMGHLLGGSYVSLEMLTDMFERYPPSTRELHGLISKFKNVARYDIVCYLSGLLINSKSRSK